MNENPADAHLLAPAKADYRWCIRARVIEPAPDGWREFLMGYRAMEEFYEHHAAHQRLSSVA